MIHFYSLSSFSIIKLPTTNALNFIFTKRSTLAHFQFDDLHAIRIVFLEIIVKQYENQNNIIKTITYHSIKIHIRFQQIKYFQHINVKTDLEIV